MLRLDGCAYLLNVDAAEVTARRLVAVLVVRARLALVDRVCGLLEEVAVVGGAVARDSVVEVHAVFACATLGRL